MTNFAICVNEMTPGLREKLPPTDSRLRPDQHALEEGMFDQVRKAVSTDSNCCQCYMLIPYPSEYMRNIVCRADLHVGCSANSCVSVILRFCCISAIFCYDHHYYMLWTTEDVVHSKVVLPIDIVIPRWLHCICCTHAWKYKTCPARTQASLELAPVNITVIMLVHGAVRQHMCLKLQNGHHSSCSQASAEKKRLEVKQRAVIKAAQQNNDTLEPQWFQKVPNSVAGQTAMYDYKGSYWEARRIGDWTGCRGIFGLAS